MKTGHEDVGHAGHVVDHFGSHGNNLAQPGADGKVLVGFAVYFAAIAPDTSFGILIKKIFTHRFASDSNVDVAPKTLFLR
jgi:hypothetical protein